MVSANVPKAANVLSGSLTDVLIGLLYYLNTSAKRKHLHNKECTEAARLRQRKESKCMLTTYLSSSDLPSGYDRCPCSSMSRDNFCMPRKTLLLGNPKKIGLQIKNKEHSGFLLQSLFLGDVTTSQAKKRDVCSFFHCFSLSFQDSPKALQDFNVIYSKKICCFMFL